MLKLSSPIAELKCIDSLKSHILRSRLGITTVEDFIKLLPYKHIKVQKINKISDINNKLLKAIVELKGIIDDITEKDGKTKKYLSAKISDTSGDLKLYWFRGINKINKFLKNGKVYIVSGELTIFNNSFSIIHPSIKNKETNDNKIQPYYSTINYNNTKINSNFFRKVNTQIFNELEIFNDYLPDHLVKKYKLMPEYEAYKNIHLSKDVINLKGAIRRLKFDELFILQLRRLYLNILNEDNVGIICKKTSLLTHFCKNILEYKLTDDQKKVIKEIYHDLASGNKMNRLLQGDVGCGKTLVAFIVSLIVIESGYQVAILVPTEVLAKQHFISISNFCKDLNISISCITGSTKNNEKIEIFNGIKTGDIKLIIGTHSLLNDKIQYDKLGLIIIDEQHKFGVLQRSCVIKNSINCDKKPHILLMTATPIPRTLAMVLYDNYSISYIKQLPSNRKPIKTVHIYENMKKYMYNFIRLEIQRGRQAYFICPLIYESNKINLSNIAEYYRELSMEFYDLNIGIIHGNMSSVNKEIEMNKFKNNETQILISTTIIEVGISVPNATVIVISDADRYGLAQLHQIRGRVGRGEFASYCFLVTKNNISKNSKYRLDILVKYSDGFTISEEDLKLRGSGNIYGEEQSGEFKLKIADLCDDFNILKVANMEAKNILSNKDSLSKYPLLKAKIEEEYIKLGNLV